jgi:hypothetical protein
MMNETEVRVNKAIDIINEFPPGQTITHLQMESIVGESRRGPRSGSYYHMVRKVRAALRDQHGRWLKTEPKLGFTIVAPGEEIVLQVGKYSRGFRTMVKATVDTQKIHINKIEDPDMKARTIDTANKMANGLSLLRNAMPIIV